MIYFIADTHFGHENIIRLCNRPFKDVKEMNTYMFQAWNARVKDEDTVYILGDLAFKTNIDDTIKLIHGLKGKKYLIKGNHDGKNLKNDKFKELFEGVYDIYNLALGNTRIVMCHYPMCEWEGYFRGSYLVYGHIHNTTNTTAFKVMSNFDKALNAGADIINYTPCTFEELVKYNQLFKSRVVSN